MGDARTAVPRLSATDRIIREALAAEEGEAGQSLVGGRPSLGGGAPLWSEPTPQPSGTVPNPIGTVPNQMFPDERVDDDDLTQVDFDRSAVALEKLRSLDTRPNRTGQGEASPASNRRPSRVPPTRPLPAALAAPPPAAPGSPRRGLPPGGPTRSLFAAPPEAPAPGKSSGALPPTALPSTEAASAVPVAPAPSGFQSLSLRHPPRVGRRIGLIIAAATAATVAPVIGAWTAHLEKSSSLDGEATAALIAPASPAGPDRSAVAALVVPTPPAPPPAPAPEPPAGPAPTAAPSDERPDPSAAAPGGAPAAEVKSDAESPSQKVAGEPRPSHKSSGGKASRHKAHQTKVRKAGGPRHGGGAPRAAVASSPHGREETRPAHDPDDTMPVSAD